MNLLSSDSSSWHFLHWAASQFGELWEAGVKSVKHCMKSVLGASTPMVEEFTTLLHNIEACLNLLPISPLNDDISSFNALTPEHFLIGAALKICPCLPYLISKNNSGDFSPTNIWIHYNNAQIRLSREKFGVLVLLKNELLSAAKWEYGRISACFLDS